MTDFRITGLDAEPFRHLFELDDAELERHSSKRYIVDEKPGFPDRVGLRDLDVGETVLLVNYTHQDAATPYRASHAIFVGEQSRERYDCVNEVPESIRIRPLSLRAFDDAGMMVDADLVDGKSFEAAIARFFAQPDVRYVHAHYAKRGCYAARIDRVPGSEETPISGPASGRPTVTPIFSIVRERRGR